MKSRLLAAFAACALFLLGVAATPAPATLPKLIPREVLFGNPERAAPQISPDGKMLAYLKADDKNVLQVFVGTIGKEDDRQVTNDPKRGIRQYRWAYNGDVLYMQDAGGNENFHVYQTNVATKATRELTPFEGVRVELLALEPEFPDVLLVTMNRRNKQLFDAYKIDLTSGEATLVAENPGDIGDWLTDPEMKIRGAVAVKPDGMSELRIRDTETSPFKVLMTWGADDEFNPIEVSKDGRTIYVISNTQSDTSGLYAMDIATKGMTLMTSNPSVDVGGVMIHPRRREVQAVSFNRDRVRWQVIDKTIEKDFKALEKVAPGNMSVVNRDLADEIWLVAYAADTAPVRYHSWNRKAQKAQFLFSAYPKLEQYTLAPMKFMEVKSRDGLTIPVMLTTPVGVPTKNLPMILAVHGGPWSRDFWGYNSNVQWLANRGYAVLQVNYRGSTGFGKKFKNAAKREFAGKMHDDLVDAVQFAIKEGIADPKRVGIMGGSYGGYATLVGLTFTPELFAAGVDIVGPSNLASLIKSFPPYWKPFMSISWTPFVGDPENPKEKADMEARSPLFKIDRIKAPLLIGQGANDPRVTQAESDQMVEAMRKAGKQVEYIIFTDEGHGFARPENRLFFNAKTEEFLAKHIGGRVEPLTEIKGHAGVIK
ncbi:MAG: S9 family peptidase [Acidobacteriota bacterium]|nr:S9 family peptidase [Acidobacteriota bacterium]